MVEIEEPLMDVSEGQYSTVAVAGNTIEYRSEEPHPEIVRVEGLGDSSKITIREGYPVPSAGAVEALLDGVSPSDTQQIGGRLTRLVHSLAEYERLAIVAILALIEKEESIND